MHSQPDPHAELAVLAQTLRAIFFAMLGSVVLFWILLGVVSPGGGPREPGPVKPVLTFVALGLAVAALYLKYRRIRPLLSPRRPGDLAEIIPQLRLYYVLCFVFGADVALLGFVLGVLGVPKADVFPFFLASATVLAFSYPRLPTIR